MRREIDGRRNKVSRRALASEANMLLDEGGGGHCWQSSMQDSMDKGKFRAKNFIYALVFARSFSCISNCAGIFFLLYSSRGDEKKLDYK